PGLLGAEVVVCEARFAHVAEAVLRRRVLRLYQVVLAESHSRPSRSHPREKAQEPLPPTSSRSITLLAAFRSRPSYAGPQPPSWKNATDGARGQHARDPRAGCGSRPLRARAPAALRRPLAVGRAPLDRALEPRPRRRVH